jgi:hypothetical protein
MGRRFPRQFDEHRLDEFGSEADPGPPADFFQGVEVWDLIDAFTRLIRTLGYSRPGEVIYDDVPVEEAGNELLEQLRKERSVLFTQLFGGGRSLDYCITMFLAILELIRQRKIGVEQDADFKDFRVFVRDPSAEPPPKPVTPKGARPSRDALQRRHPRRPSARQVESMREMMEDSDLEKTEFDEILESIKIPEVEPLAPAYTDDEIMGRKEQAEGESPAPAGAPAADAPAPGAEQGGQEPTSDNAVQPPPDSPDAGKDESPPAGQ